jgi:hypothetical protein
LRLELPTGFFQRCLGRGSWLRIEMQIEHPLGVATPTGSASIRIQGVGGGAQVFEKLRTMGPRMIQTIREQFRAGPEKRRHLRLSCAQPFHVYPVLPDLELAEMIDGQLRDISQGGIGFLSPRPISCKEIYCHFDRLSPLAPFAIRARVVRMRSLDRDRYDVGAAFGNVLGDYP